MEQIKTMDFGSRQGANHSDTQGIARICNAAMAQKTRFYVPDSVKYQMGQRTISTGTLH
jgi:hypothetical protein